MRVYINPIAIGVLVSLLIIYLLFIPIFVHQFRKYGTLKIRKNIIIASFTIYMITAWFMTILPLPSIQTVREMKQIIPNFRPFMFVTTFLNESGFVLTKPGTWYSSILSSSCFTVVFNVFLTIPFGVYLRKYFNISLAGVAIMGFLLSLFYELTQYSGLYGIYPKAYRLADIDDLIVNTFGAVVGYWLTGYIKHFLPNSEKDKRINKEEASFSIRLVSLILDSISIIVLYELSRVVVYWNAAHRKWDLVIFLVSEAIVFIIIPLCLKNKQTIGMFILRLNLTDEMGECIKLSKALVHNLFIGLWLHVIFTIQGMVEVNSIVMIIVQFLFIIFMFVMLLMSILKRKVCYYWESWFETYLKTNLTSHGLELPTSGRDRNEKC